MRNNYFYNHDKWSQSSQSLRICETDSHELDMSDIDICFVCVLGWKCSNSAMAPAKQHWKRLDDILEIIWVVSHHLILFHSKLLFR